MRKSPIQFTSTLGDNCIPFTHLCHPTYLTHASCHIHLSHSLHPPCDLDIARGKHIHMLWTPLGIPSPHPYTILFLIHIHLPSLSSCHPTFIHQIPSSTHPILLQLSPLSSHPLVFHPFFLITHDISRVGESTSFVT